MATYSATQKLLSQMDDGPKECLFETANVAARGLNTRELLVSVLPFVEQFKHRAQELEELLNDFETFSPEVKAVSCTQSVCRFIHNSNKIEFAGLPTEGETQELLRRGGAAISNKEREVLQMARLMGNEYSRTDLRRTDFEELGFSPESLQKWHLRLCQDLVHNPGQFRVGLAYTEHDDGTFYKYPHHSLIPHALLSLGFLVRRLCQATTRAYEGWSMRILYAFGIAAFAQFHFVDIHPFSDGNGRLCRFISKRILDWVCQVPLPQFADRDRYLNALIHGRGRGALAAPQDLMELLLDTAIKHFRQTRESFCDRKPYTFICCPSSSIEQEFSKKEVPDKAIPSLTAAFETLGESKTVELELEWGLFVLKKWPEIEFRIDSI